MIPGMYIYKFQLKIFLEWGSLGSYFWEVNYHQQSNQKFYFIYYFKHSDKLKLTEDLLKYGKLDWK